MQIESFSISPLQKVVPAYLYQQYFDDDDLQGFIAVLRKEFQGYLDWFNQTPLSVYTNASINGSLLDWIGSGLYGIRRPVVSTGSSRSIAGYAALPYAQTAYLERVKVTTGSAFLVNDDIYKRTLTWHAYLGDGRNVSIHWLRRRVARFLYGANGTDVPVDYLANVSIIQPPISFSAAYRSVPYATQAYITRKNRRVVAAHALQIIVPNTPVSVAFQDLVEQGYLALPFQVRFSVLITS